MCRPPPRKDKVGIEQPSFIAQTAEIGQNVYVGIAVMVLIPVVTFGLFGLAFVMLLPFGIIAAMTRESVAPGISPFAEDRLPDKQIDVLDRERAQ